jgi:hypothetical protein
MQLEHHWQIEKEVAYIKVGGVISIDDIRELDRTIIQEYLEKGSPPIHLIFDVHIEKYPTRVREVRSNFTLHNHENVGWVFVVNSNPIINMLGVIVAKFTKAPYKAVSRVNEALSIIRQIDRGMRGH